MALGEKRKEYVGTSGYPFSALYDSDCAGPDGDTIDRGEIIVMIDREPWHQECAERAGYRVPE
jgi:hypothetical protein